MIFTSNWLFKLANLLWLPISPHHIFCYFADGLIHVSIWCFIQHLWSCLTAYPLLFTNCAGSKKILSWLQIVVYAQNNLRTSKWWCKLFFFLMQKDQDLMSRPNIENWSCDILCYSTQGTQMAKPNASYDRHISETMCRGDLINIITVVATMSLPTIYMWILRTFLAVTYFEWLNP